MKRAILLLGLFLLLSSTLFSSTPVVFRFTDPSGQPVTRVKIYIDGDGYFYTYDENTFFTYLAPGSHHIIADSWWAYQLDTTIDVPDVEDTVEYNFVLNLKPKYRLTFHVTDGVGPLENINVSVEKYDDYWGNLTTDAQGNATFYLPADTFMVSVNFYNEEFYNNIPYGTWSNDNFILTHDTTVEVPLTRYYPYVIRFRDLDGFLPMIVEDMYPYYSYSNDGNNITFLMPRNATTEVSFYSCTYYEELDDGLDTTITLTNKHDYIDTMTIFIPYHRFKMPILLKIAPDDLARLNPDSLLLTYFTYYCGIDTIEQISPGIFEKDLDVLYGILFLSYKGVIIYWKSFDKQIKQHISRKDTFVINVNLFPDTLNLTVKVTDSTGSALKNITVEAGDEINGYKTARTDAQGLVHFTLLNDPDDDYYWSPEIKTISKVYNDFSQIYHITSSDTLIEIALSPRPTRNLVFKVLDTSEQPIPNIPIEITLDTNVFVNTNDQGLAYFSLPIIENDYDAHQIYCYIEQPGYSFYGERLNTFDEDTLVIYLYPGHRVVLKTMWEDSISPNVPYYAELAGDYYKMRRTNAQGLDTLYTNNYISIIPVYPSYNSDWYFAYYVYSDTMIIVNTQYHKFINVTLTLHDAQGNPIKNASLRVEDSYDFHYGSTDYNGQAKFNIVNGDIRVYIYHWKIDPKYYEPGLYLNVYSENDTNIDLILDLAPLRYVYVHTANKPVPNAKVSLISWYYPLNVKYTDENGYISMYIRDSYYYFYKVEKSGYITAYGPFDDDTTHVELKPIANYNVTFYVVDTNNLPVANAALYMFDTVFYTDNQGYAQKIMEPGTFYVRAEKQGFPPKLVKFGVTSDRTVKIVLGTDYNAVKPTPAINIYPNPVRDWLTVENAQGQILEIFDITGKKVKQLHIVSDRQAINVRDLTQGTYLVKVGGEVFKIFVY